MRNVVVIIVIALLYFILHRGYVLVAITSTIAACALIASYTIVMESPGNLQMLALILFPTCLGGFLPKRSYFWFVYGMNFLLMLLTVWLLREIKSVDLENRSIVTLATLMTLLALLIDTLTTSYRASVRNTFEQMNEINTAQQKLSQLDADLDTAVTQRIKAEAVNDQLTQTGRLALEAAGARIIYVNLDSGDVTISEDFLEVFNLSHKPINLDTLFELVHEDNREEFVDLIQQASKTNIRLNGDFRIRADTPVYWMFMLETQGDKSSETATLAGMVVNVTGRTLEQKTELALEYKTHESQRLESLGVLAGAIAHDFNNLLQVIMLNADLARHSLKPDSKPIMSIEKIIITVERATELCSELLAYSGKGQFVIEPFDLSKMVQDMSNLLNISVPKTAALTYQSDGSTSIIEGDINQIRQVVMNLITNAGEAIGNTQGEIKVKVETLICNDVFFHQTEFLEELPPGRYACISVADNGAGMDERTRKKIFDPFFTTKSTGHGLGLSAVLGIIRGHKGTIRIESATGGGTTATIICPISSLPIPVIKDRTTTTEVESHSGLILFADDEEEIRHLAQVVLEDPGYKLLNAKDGNEAVERFKAHHEELQLVILDLMMPNKTGLEAYLEIAEFDSSVPVVFSSGFNENEALQNLPPKTRAAFLKKPYRADDLRRFVRNIIEPRHNQKR